MLEEDKIRVVVVDDSPAMQQLLNLELQLDGRFHVVGTAGDGWDGLHLVATERPDAVILDLQMPRMDGLNALHQILGTAPNVKVVVYTGMDDARDYTILSHGAHAMYQKTEPISGVLSCLAAICG